MPAPPLRDTWEAAKGVGRPRQVFCWPFGLMSGVEASARRPQRRTFQDQMASSLTADLRAHRDLPVCRSCAEH
jgi:hypothetical protein